MIETETALLLVRADQMSHPRYLDRLDNVCTIHFHQALEFMLVLDGRIDVLLDGRTFVLKKGQLLMVSSHMIHRYVTREGTHSHVLVMVAPLYTVPQVNARINGRQFSHPVDENPSEEICFLFSFLCRKYAENELPPDTLCALTQALILLMIDQNGLTQASSNKANENARRIVEYTHQHFQEQMSLSTLAEHLCYSRSRTSHLFSQCFHCTYLSYVDSLRCRYAASLLRQQNFSVLDISIAAGFNSVRTFYRAFKVFTGMTPTQYAQEKSIHPDVSDLIP